MKIRTQFYILIAGIVIVPFLVGFGLFAIQQSRQVESQTVPGYDEIVKDSGASGLNRDEWDRVSGYITRRPSDMDFIVIESERTVLFSTVADFPAGSALDDVTLYDYIRSQGPKYLFQMDVPVSDGDRTILVVTRILRRGGHKPPDPMERWLGTLAILLGGVFVFSAIGSLLIARSITKSVTVLEKTTRRIAAGDLDLTVDARGSNEITSLTASLNTMRLALKEEEARRSRFIMGVTHDLKTPLALIKGYSEAIGDGLAEDPPSRQRYVDIIGTKVDQLDGMIDDLIDFVRVDTGEWRSNLESHPLASFLKNFFKRVEADAAILGRHAESHIDLDDSLVISFDGRLVQRALENLVNNALRYSEKGGTVVISAKAEDKAAVIEIADDGQGMEESELGHIFDLFYRGSSSRREQGMGLGLSVVKSVVDSHGWDISVQSTKGSGATFRISIPLMDGLS